MMHRMFSISKRSDRQVSSAVQQSRAAMVDVFLKDAVFPNAFYFSEKAIVWIRAYGFLKTCTCI